MSASPRPDLLIDPLYSSPSIHSTGSTFQTAYSLYPALRTPTSVVSNGTHEFTEDAPIIAVMGPKGAGKSTFVKVATGADIDFQIRDSGLTSYTQQITSIKCHRASGRGTITFLDTPGLSDGNQVEIFEAVEARLRDTYGLGVKLSGILYLQPIIHSDTADILSHNTDMIHHLCAAGAFAGVRLVTTKWNQLQGVERGARFEEELRNNYRKQFDSGMQMQRFTDTYSSAWHIIGSLLGEPQPHQRRNGTTGQPLPWLNRVARYLKGLIHRIGPSTKKLKLAQRKELWNECRTLLVKVIGDASMKTLVTGLTSGDAQTLVDFLNATLHEKNTITNTEGRRILSLLCDSAKYAQVFPRCYVLKGIQYEAYPTTAGGFADVHIGTHKKQKICLKIVRTYEKKTNELILRTHMKELALWAHLSHQNILPFYGAYIIGTPPRVCLVSPWMEAGNLRHFLEHSPTKPRMPLISDVINGLSYLHRLGVVHGDLKGQNVMISDNGRALISDFGLSYIVATAQLTSTIPLGTIRWTAPEVLNQTVAGSLAITCDVWSFGCLCYEVLTLKNPFHQYSKDFQVMRAVEIGKEVPVRPGPEDNDQIDDRMWDLMVDCWNYTPEKRPDCEQIRDALASLGIQDTRSSTQEHTEGGSTFLESMRRKLDSRIDYELVRNILRSLCRQAAQVEMTSLASISVS